MVKDQLVDIQKIQGNSMNPNLESGDFVLVDKFSGEIQPGQIVILSSPVSPLRLVKRVKETRQIPGEDISMFWVEGDNKETSVDSRNFGEINAHLIEGKARAVIFPPRRARLL